VRKFAVRTKLFLLVPLLVVFLSSCSWFGAQSEGLSERSPTESSELAPDNISSDDGAFLEDSEADQDLPFEFTVVEEANDGTTLYVLVELESRTDWNSESVVFRLVGMSGVEEISQSTLSLREWFDSQPGSAETSSVLSEGEPVRVGLVIPSKGISEYHVELLWGEDAKRSAGTPLNVAAPPVKEPLEIRNIQVVSQEKPCDKERCPTVYRLEAYLFNGGTKLISSATLGVGFISSQKKGKSGKLDLSEHIPENEESLEIRGMRLAPGTGKAVRLVFDREVPPELMKYGISPNVRVISSGVTG